MQILGIDPGTATTGWGIVETNGKASLQAVAYGLIETNKSADSGQRLIQIQRQLTKIFARYHPNFVAIERLFFATNAKTAMQVGQAAGVMLLTAASAGLPVAEYAPGRIKKILTGNGRADKLEIQRHVRKHLGNQVRKKKGAKTHFDNAADALAVAICHSLSQNSDVKSQK